MSDLDYQDVYQILLNRNKQTADSFLTHLEFLSTQLSTSDLQHWYKITLALVDKGWHSWRCALDYLTLSRLCQEKMGNNVLIHVGHFAIDLLELSQQCAVIYLKGVQSTLEKGAREQLINIESVGLSLQHIYPQASNLLTNFYETAFQFENEESKALKYWSETVLALAETGRQAVSEFVQLTMQNRTVDWVFASRLYLRSPDIGRSFIQLSEELTECWEFSSIPEESLHGEGIQDLFRILLYRTALTHPQIDWLLVLDQKNLNDKKCSQVIELSKALFDPRLILALIEVVNDLPLNRSDVLQVWVKEGNQLSLRNHPAGVAFLKLESMQGQQRLDRLLGRVRFSEHKRSMQMYIEGMSNVPLLISESTSEFVHCEEMNLYFPSLISHYGGMKENSNWLKLAISHQVASHEFGTFTYQFSHSPFPFTRLFNSFNKPNLASILFRLLEAGRLDWRLEHEYKGIKQLLQKTKSDVIELNVIGEAAQHAHTLLKFILLITLDGIKAEDKLNKVQSLLITAASRLKRCGASVFDTVDVLKECYAILVLDSELGNELGTKLPRVHYRGQLDLRSTFSVAQFDLSPEESIGEELGSETVGPPAEGDVSELVQGNAPEAEGIELLDSNADINEGSTRESGQEGVELGGVASSQQQAQFYHYDEWDYQINDYRPAWCTLYETKSKDEDRDYVTKTLLELDHVSRNVQKQLKKIRPELHQKIKGVIDGEELDLDRALEAIIDRRSGITPSENIYVQKQKQLRDVAALFLLDMSASTDDEIKNEGQISHGHKIIDLEKQAVILMAEGLEKLGDRYAICGFSGYGREKVEYLVCKSFEDSYDDVTKARIGGIKPCRSTRMGPAIRHASKMLQRTDAKVKVLIILSDGYPQDYDYGRDRSSKTYGVKDTAKSLIEASSLGVESFCITVDPSGHDYLKEMCPPKKYMVMQDILQLPTELSKIYQNLTSA